MATLIFTAVGSLVGGPLGGAIGALVGRQVDAAILGSPHREGPRLKELAVTTSSYGTPLARHFGTMRVAGTIIWATDLVEHREKKGGGKRRPSTTTYSYTASLAVALASRPILEVRRIWADGNLLRGAAGDLKTAGSFRLYTGEHDQLPDPLIAAAEGAGMCPAFRGTAYVVFEDLQLADFGNRIPALTFEVIADTGVLNLDLLTNGVVEEIDASLPLTGLAGFSCEGALADTLALLDPVFPMDCDAGGLGLTIARERLQAQPIALGEPAVAVADGDFGKGEGYARKRAPAPPDPPTILRYYDLDRDYQPGLQRAPGRPAPGQPRSLELPAAMTAADARRLIDGTARRASWARETISWRSSELDPGVAPGTIVRLPGHSGRWQVSEWEWREKGIELTLSRLAPSGEVAAAAADPGRASLPPDLARGNTVLAAFELPWDGSGGGDAPALFAAVSSASAGWSGAALFVDQGGGELISLGPSGRARSVMGQALDALPSANPLLFDRSSSVIVQLLADDMALADATARQLAMGANRALLGREIVQFGSAIPLGNRRWSLGNLLRGRGGSESEVSSHAAGDTFILLDGTPVDLDATIVGTGPDALIAAVGIGDNTPVTASIALRGITQRPLAPVHARSRALADGSLELSWTRRARGAWAWNDGVDTPLHEEAETYQVIFGPLTSPVALWDTAVPWLTVDPATLAQLSASLPAGEFRVRQRGSYALSEALLLTTIS